MRELNELQNQLASLFHRRAGEGDAFAEAALKADWASAVDIAEDDEEFLIAADLPELKKEDVQVAVKDGVLSISGERKHESEETDKKKKFHRIERSFGRYVRSFRLPDNVDPEKVKAKFEDGVLRVRLPKCEQLESSQHSIPIE